MWIDPTNGDRMAVVNDGGVSISVNRGHTWDRVQFPIAQMYHVTVDNQIPYFVYGNKQDGSSYRGPSNSLQFGGFGGGGDIRGARGIRHRRRKRLLHARSGGQQHHLVERNGLGQRGRQRHASSTSAITRRARSRCGP